MIFSVVKNNISKIVNATTDGAPNMTEKEAGFVTFSSNMLIVVPVHGTGHPEATYAYTVRVTCKV
jgi:hypothetical protein